jgi:adenylate cyclase class 2
MFEVELKLPAEHDSVRRELQQREAIRCGELTQRDRYYNAPHRDFAQTDEALRIRTERPTDDSASQQVVATTYLTYKGAKLEESSKTRPEHETKVGSEESLVQIIESLGFEIAAAVIKHREVYEIEQFEITLDNVEEVGEFIEIEREIKSEEDVEVASNKIREFASGLGIDPTTHLRESYLEMKLRNDN